MPAAAHTIEQLLSQGKVPQARKAIASLPKEHPQRAGLLRRVDNVQLRKAQRQAKVSDFARLAGDQQQLALARLQGSAALDELSRSNHPDAPRAQIAAAADAPALRKALRKLPGPPELGLGFAALLAGDDERAEQALNAAARQDPRRAELGLALIAARAGAAQPALTALEAVAPLPGSVFPVTARWRKRLQSKDSAHHTATLRQLLISGSAEDVERALRTWPRQDAQGRAWLALRLGDRRWAEGSDASGIFSGEHLVTPLIELWETAASHPPLAADACKRLLILAGQSPQAAIPAFKHWWRLYHSHGQLASEIMDWTSKDLPLPIIRHWVSALRELAPKRLRDGLPPCLLLLQLRIDDDEARIFDEQLDADEWKQACAMLDAAYGEQALWFDHKLAILQRRGNMGELRKCCATVLRNQPQRIVDILPYYLLAAYKDRRAHKQIAREVQELLRLAPHDPHLLLLACERDIPHDPPADQQLGQFIRALARADDAQLTPWAQHAWGQNASIDLLRLTFSRRFTSPQRKAWLKQSRLQLIHEQLCGLPDLQLGGCMWFLRQWQEAKQHDWRAIYHLLRAMHNGWDDHNYPDHGALLIAAWKIFRDHPQASAQPDHHRQRLAAWVDDLDLPDDFEPVNTRLETAAEPAPLPRPTSPAAARQTAEQARDWRSWMPGFANQPAICQLFADREQAHAALVLLPDPLTTIMDLCQPAALPETTDSALPPLLLKILTVFRDQFHRRCDLGQLSALEINIANWQRQLQQGPQP